MTATVSVERSPFPDGLAKEIGDLCDEAFGASAIDRAEIAWRLERLPLASVVVAREGGELIGAKLGYALGSRRFYSWLGAVRPDRQGRGLARRLMDAQHEWARNEGFAEVETVTLPENRAMLALNIASGFHPVGTYDRRGPRVLLRKALTPSEPGA